MGFPMNAIRVVGEVDTQGRLVATVPKEVAAGPVEVLIIPQGASEDDAGEAWMEGIAREWSDDLNDPRQDIYSLEDGVPVDESR
jgi:hypothetical protein